MQRIVPVTEATIDRIVAMDADPERRNLLITQSYHDLSAAMAGVLGRSNANWCTFACWASSTAGRFIRKEEVPRLLRSHLLGSDRLHRHIAALQSALGRVHDDAPIDHEVNGVFAAAEAAVDDVALYIRQGNAVVFEELGRLFARFLDTFGGGRPRSDEALAALLDRYETGTVRPDAVERDAVTGLRSTRRGGQTLLREVIRHYYEALTEVDPSRRAQLVLLANAEGGIHEQTRLQTYIAGSFDVPVADLLHGLAARAVAGTVRDEVDRHDAHAHLGRLLHPLADELERLWHEFTTVELMTLELPGGAVRLGHDVPALPGQPLFPAGLREITQPDLRETLEQYGALEPVTEGRPWLSRVEDALARRLSHREVAAGSAARDWASLSERMRFIFELFRCRQQDETLLAQPFTAERRAALLAEVARPPVTA